MMRSLLLLAVIGTSCAFMPTIIPTSFKAQNKLSMYSRPAGQREVLRMSSEEGGAERRFFLRLAAGAALAGVVGTGSPNLVGAEVFFDTERYGDKELKVALINQVKQQWRALFEKKPELIVPVFKLAMHDALTYDPKTGAGGLDGSIVKKKDDPALAYIKPAIEEVERIRETLLAKTEVSYSDLIAFAGSVAIEATGGPRVKVQLGRIDGKKPNPPSNMRQWDQKNPASAGVKAALMTSGLSAQEAVLLAGSVGQLRRAANAMSMSLKNKPVCNPEEENDESNLDCQGNEEGYFGMYSPVTIVSETNKQFGKKRGASAVNTNTGFDSAKIAGLAGDAQFGNQYLKSLVKDGAKDKLGEALLGDEELKKWVMEYGKSDSRKFQRDAVTAYLKMVELGRQNTSR